jgi:hypothetical protein
MTFFTEIFEGTQVTLDQPITSSCFPGDIIPFLPIHRRAGMDFTFQTKANENRPVMSSGRYSQQLMTATDCLLIM